MIPVTSAESLGRVLRAYRKKMGLSQTEAGEKFNLSQKTVSNIEAGLSGIRLSSVFRYMSALGLEMQFTPRQGNNNEKALW